MDDNKVVRLHPELEGFVGECSVFLRRGRGGMVEYEVDGAAQNRGEMLAVAAMLEAVTADLRAAAARIANS